MSFEFVKKSIGYGTHNIVSRHDIVVSHSKLTFLPKLLQNKDLSIFV
jgi:hypothetical protein